MPDTFTLRSSSPLRSISLVVAFALLVATAVLATPEPAEARTYRCNGQEATILGTRGDDMIEGTEADDVIVTFGGDDVIFSGAGNDTVCSGAGDDVVFAGAGDDRVILQRGNDFAYGGPGDDYLLGGSGDDVIEGGPGSTTARGHNGNDELWGSWCNPPGTMQHYCRWPEFAVYPDEYADLLGGSRTLRLGSSGDDVRQLQALLVALDYEPGPIDGSFGAATSAAVRAFQEVSGLDADGAVGPSTRAALQGHVGLIDSPEMPDDWLLGKAGVLKSGSTGEAVAALQRTLDGLGYRPGRADGVLGSRTVAAIRAFQQDNGLVVDGRAGMSVKLALFGDLGDPKVLRGGRHYDTCNSFTLGRGCEGRRGLREGAPWDAAAAEEWRPLIAEVFTEWDLEEEIDRAVAVAACEGLADPMITTPAGSGHYWIGLFQHTDRYWEARAIRADIAGASPFDPRSNVVVAALLVRESIDSEHSRGAWAHFGCGQLLGFWPSG